ncbi:sodium/proline symporter PutP [Roseospira marina]|uniref:Sodium/proline symporter n=1 Tax=Roseospira marina TaxID=140057 RepID=A0A5M6IAF9_9PROT|nr:sodium/proline symporter PutP [Roseospira marina]KAA5605142.1 sodium/proline symporter PutP [Roseospira marina]MBB4314897.1 sodium/proline symporter [Roseospira marina]MBB5087897.1 sodium/proline symporter [Roseospira marina]
MDATTITFIIYLLGMIAIGVIAYRVTDNLSDYILGGRSLGPGVTALSAGASDMSGWLLLGLPGALFAAGMNQIWIAIGLAIGAYLNWQLVAPRLRVYTEQANNALTLPDFLENRFADDTRLLRVLSAVVILLFFTFYTSSGLVAGAKLFEATFGLPYATALWIGAGVIICYTFLGGFLAVSWTDFIQGILMFLALIIVPIVTLMAVGSWDDVTAAVAEKDANFLDAFHDMTLLGIISLAAWGLGYFGQPHILARFMAIRSLRDIPTARLIGMGWMVAGLFGAIFTGFIGIAYFGPEQIEDPEKVFILLTQVLFHPLVSGILLAAILAAVMSTIDSQLLVSSSAITEDFYKQILRKEASDKELVWVGRLSVLIIAVIATLLATDRESSVLSLVSYAWAGFGAAFGPIVLLSLLWRGLSRNGALFGMIAGAVTVVVWKAQTGGLFDVYEILPGFIVCGLVAILVSLFGKPASEDTKAEYDRVRAMWR